MKKFFTDLAPTFVAVLGSLIVYGFLKAAGLAKLEEKLEGLMG